jgi:carbon-monoxide dehydrogenase medium subunit
VGDKPVRSAAAEEVLRGGDPTEALFADAAEAIDGEIAPASDLHGSSEFRRHVAKVLVRRALAKALARARGGVDSEG